MPHPFAPAPSTLATALGLLLTCGAALAQDSTLLNPPAPLPAPETAAAPAVAEPHPAGESGYRRREPIAGFFDLQAFGQAEYRQTDWYRDDYDYETFFGYLETRLLAPAIPGLAAAHVEPFVRTVIAGNGAAADEPTDPFYENIFLYGVGLAWRPVRCFPAPTTDAPGRATLYDWLEPLRLYAQKDWWTGLRGDLGPLPRDDWRIGLDYYLETRSVGEPHHHPLWAEIFWDLRWHDTNFLTDDFRTWVFNSTIKAGVNAPYLGEKQALQPYLALDLNASGDEFYLFNRVSMGGGLRFTTDVPLAKAGTRWTLRTRWFAEYQQEIGYFGENRTPDGVDGPDFEARFGVSFSLNRY